MTLAESASGHLRPAAAWPLAILTTSSWTLPALGLTMVGIEGGVILAQARDALHPNLVLLLAQGAVYLLAVALLLRGAPVSMGVVAGVAAVLSLLPLVAPPFHSTDIYRYIWDGQVQGAGLNPYLHLPNDAALAGLRDAAIWPRINRADYAPTIYPPVAQVIFYLTTRVTPTVLGMKGGFLLFEVVAGWAVLRTLEEAGLPRSRLLVFVWSPLAIWEIAGAGHIDAAMMAFVMLAVLARMRNRYGLAGVALGAAVLVKFLPALILPALWRRRDWRLPLCCAATLVAGYLPYLGAGRKVLGFLSGYAGEEGLRDGTGFWVARLVGRSTGTMVPSLLYAGLVVVVLGLVALAVMTRIDDTNRPIVGSLALAATGMLALSPAYPWYFLWLVPFLSFIPSPAVLWLTAGGTLLYWDNARTVPWMGDVLFGGACLLAAGTLWLRLAQTRPRQFA